MSRATDISLAELDLSDAILDRDFAKWDLARLEKEFEGEDGEPGGLVPADTIETAKLTLAKAENNILRAQVKLKIAQQGS